MMDQLSEFTDWGLWANIAEVLMFLGVVVAAILGWLWKSGRWLFAKRKDETPPPPPAKPIPQIGLPDRVEVFGREAEVADIRARLRDAPEHNVALVNSGAVLAGQGGIGKTTLARYYADCHAADYSGVLWTLAATRQDIINGLCAACPSLGLDTPVQPQLHHAQQVVSAIAASDRPWLIVFDNLETRKDLDGLIPTGAHVLVTTRQGAGWPGWGVVQTEVLNFDTPTGAGVQLLMAHAKRDDAPEDARALAEDLGGLPLALIVMGGYLHDQGLGFAEGRARLAEVLEHVPPNAGYPTSLMGALRLSYDQLGADAQTIAKLCAYWAPEGLGPWLLLDAPGGQNWGAVLDLIPEPVQALAQDGAQVRAGFTELAARSLLTGTGDARAMHRMSAACLQALDRGELDHGELAPAATALLAAVYPGGDRNPGYSPQWPLSSRLTPHVLALRASTAAPPVAAWDYLLNQAGIYLNAIADYPGYLPLAQENLRVKLARGLPESDRGIAVAHASLGVAHRRLRDWDAAEAELGRALALHQAHRRGREDHADTLDLMGGLMLDLVQDGQRDRLDRAIHLFQQALAIRRRVAGRRSDAVAGSLNNLGGARRLQGRGRAAARLIAAALGIWRGVLAPGDARLGGSAVNVGACWLEAGDAARAEKLLREGLEIRETAFAAQPQHPDRRNAAGWLINCLLVRALGGVNTGVRQAEAKRLCAQYGFDYAERVAHARNYPDTAT